MARRRLPHSIWAALAGATVLGLTLPAQAGAAKPAASGVPGGVHALPSVGTPHFRAKTGTVEQVRQLVTCGGEVYGVGSFNQIVHGNRTLNRNNIFRFGQTAPYNVSPWNPNVNGVVNSIAFVDNRCGHAYIGGQFTKVGSTGVRNIAEVSTVTGRVIRFFGTDANGRVETLAGYKYHLLVGGFFTSINGSNPGFNGGYMLSLNPGSGRNDGFLNLHIGGNYRFPGVLPNTTRVYNQVLNSGRTRDLVMGDFTTAGGKRRQQIFMLDLAARQAYVTRWTNPRFDGSRGNLPHGYPYQCGPLLSFYIRAAAWAPNGKTIYIATTGNHPWNLSSRGARQGLCDAAAAFNASPTNAALKWINYTGCDSLYSAAASSAVVYVAGHERRGDNKYGCNSAGRGAKPDPGLGGLWAAGRFAGRLILNSRRNAGFYQRARGLGADDMLLTRAGLWIASDNFQGTQSCGNRKGYAGICFLSYH